MSSPKRAAKPAAKVARKPARKTIKRGKASLRRSPPLPHPAAGISAEAARLAGAIESGLAEGRLDVVTARALQQLIGACCRLYTARREAGEDLVPVPRHSLAATDVMVTASGLLRAADLAVFELGMWQNWTGR